MKRLVAYVVGAVVLAVVVCLPVLAWNTSGDEVSEETTITSYDADFQLSASGDLHVVETLAVDFPGGGKHGIFRFWDRADDSAPGVRRVPDDITVTRDGAEEPWTEEEQQHGRFTVAKIGSAGRVRVPGQHTYVIDYTMQDAIEPGTDAAAGQPSQFYWNLVPGGWQQHIDAAVLTVHLPAASPSTVECAVGAGRTTGCSAEGAGTDTLTVRVADLDRNTPVTLLSGLDVPTPGVADELPWRARWDRVLGTSVPALLVVLLLALLAGGLGLAGGLSTRETPPGFPLQYAPPDGVGPAQGAYILTERVDQEQYVATLMHAAERGAITLDKQEDAWVVSDKAGAAGWAGLDPVSVRIAHLLGGPGTSFVTSPKDVTAGQRLKTEISAFEGGVKEWAKQQGLMTSAALGPLGGLLVLVGLGLVIANTAANPFIMTTLSLVPGLFAIGGLAMLAPGASTRRTRAGRDLWSRVGGFHRVLSTPSSKDRFDFSGRQDLYTAYVPWAVAFGCAEEWAAKYRVEVGSEPAVARLAAGLRRAAHRRSRRLDGGRLRLHRLGGDRRLRRHPDQLVERGRLLRRRGRRWRGRRLLVTHLLALSLHRTEHP